MRNVHILAAVLLAAAAALPAHAGDGIKIGVNHPLTGNAAPADQLTIGYRGVKFDETGQNTLSATCLIQLQGKGYKPVWPEDRATAKFEWPMKVWRKQHRPRLGSTQRLRAASPAG